MSQYCYLCTNCLELIAWDNNQRWIAVSLYLNLGLRRTSSEELLITGLSTWFWRCRNFISIISISINTHDWPAASASEAE